MTYEEFMARSGVRDDKTVTSGLKALAESKAKQATQITQPIEPQPISQERQLNIARDFYNQKTNVAGPYKDLPYSSFTKATGTVLPSDTTQQAIKKTEPIFTGRIAEIAKTIPTEEPIRQIPTQKVAGTTKQVGGPEDQSDIYGLTRSVSDIATIPIVTGVAAISPDVSISDAVGSSIEMAKKDFRTSGNFGIDNGVKQYFQLRGFDPKIEPYKQMNVADYAALGTMGIFNMFGDVLFGIGELTGAAKLAKNKILYKKVGETVATDVPTFLRDVEITSKDKAMKITTKPKDVKLNGKTVAIVNPAKQEVKITGYVNRFKNKELSNTEIGQVANEISKQTGIVVKPSISGSDLVLTASKPTVSGVKQATKALPQVTKEINPIAKGLSDLVEKKTTRITAIKPTVPQPTINVSEGLKNIAEKKRVSVSLPENKTFKDITGDSVELAKTKIAGVDVRNLQRENGNLGGAIESYPYTKEEISLIRKEDKTPKSKYLYHITPTTNLNSIVKEGLVTGKKPRFEGVSSSNKISLAANEATAKVYGSGKDVILRVKPSYKLKNLEPDLLAGHSSYLASENIPPNALEIKKGSKWESLIPEKKVETPQQIRERLAIEKEQYKRSQGSEPVVTTIKPVKETAPVAPNFKTASSYEIGEYYKAKEIWDAKQVTKRPAKQKAAVSNEEKANKIANEYTKLIDNPNPIEDDFVKMMELEERYNNITGKSILDHNDTVKTSMDGASLDRDYREDLLNNEDNILWSRGPKVKGSITQATQRPLRPGEQIITDIETGRVKFNVPDESLKIVRKYGARLMKNVAGTEGHAIGNIIGHDSLNNPLLLAHELTHLLTKDGGYFLKLISDPSTKTELMKMYYKYYPGSPKDKKLANNFVVYNEGMAEFIRQSLFNPTKIGKDFPNLTRNFLGDGPLGNKDVANMYNDINDLIYKYQNLSPLKQKNSLIASDIDFKKLGLKSVVTGRTGRIISYTQDSLYPLNSLDKMTSGQYNKDTNYFNVDKNGKSLEMLASMVRPSQNIAMEGLNPVGETTRFINEKGDIEELLPFNIGKFLQEIQRNGDYEDYGSYLNVVDSKRDRLRLEEFKDNIKKLLGDLSNEDDIAKRKVIEAKITKTEKQVKRFEQIVSSQPESAAKQDLIIEQNKDRFAKYDNRKESIFKAYLKLKERTGIVSKKAADEMIARPGYAPSFRQVVSDIDDMVSGSGKRSSLSQELMGRTGSNKPVINPLAVIPKLHIATLSKFNSQSFYNLLHDKGLKEGLVQEIGKGTVNEPGSYVYSNNGKTTRFKVLDPIVSKSVEATYGKRWFDDNFLKFVDDILHGGARVFQKATTQYNPYFAFFKNLPLDIPTSYVMSRTGYKPGATQVNTLIDMLRSGEKRTEIDRYNDEYNSIGGNEANMYEVSYDKMNPKEIIQKISGDKTKFREGFDLFADQANKILSVTERFTRFAEYVKARENGDNVAESFEKSRNVSGSFHKSGIYARKLTRYLPYSNAGIQLSKQFIDAAGTPLGRKRIGVATAIASTIAFLSIAKKIYDIDTAETEEDKEKAMNRAYQYLDKSMYEKQNYYSLGSQYKVASNPILSAPGNLIGLIMLSNRIPEYKINYLDFAYQTAAGLIPNQITPEIDSKDSFLESVAGKVTGAIPLVNGILALAGYKTYPGLKQLENQGELKNVPVDRYKEDTNNLAILLGQLTGMSPIRLEAFIKSQLGTGGSYLTDAVGSFLMSDSKKEELGIVNKDLKTLLFTSPTKSAITQSQRTLRGETAEKLYDKSDSIESDIASMERRARAMLAQNGVKNPEELPISLQEDIRKLESDYSKKTVELKEVQKAKDALMLLSKYEVRGKEIPTGFKNTLNKYILAIDSGKFDSISEDDMKMIDRVSSAYSNIGKTDWNEVPNAKK